MKSIKQLRSAGRIRQILSDVLLTEVSDPRLFGITITDVKIDRELRHASIYVGALGSDVRERDVMDGLSSARGYLRRQVAMRLQARVTPDLNFIWDPTLARAQRIESLFEDIEIPPEESVIDAEE
ncbi:MAG: 30S ribosome-binding factor RbfA [Candidatus Promineifilaceae bacterium]